MAQALLSVPTQDFVQKTLAAALDAGVTAAATLNNITGIQNLPGVLIVDRVDANGAETPNKVEVIKYTATSGSTVTTLTRGLAGTSDQDHAISAIVEFVPDVLWAQSVYDGLSQVIDPATGLIDTSKVVAAGTAVTLTGTETLTNKTLTSPKVGTAINDTNGNEIIKTPATSSAVNEITITNAATGNAPTISATGGDTNIDLTLVGKGTGKVRTDARYGTITSDTDGSTVTFDMATSNLHTVTLGGNRTLAVSNVAVGQTFILRLVQDGTGSRTVTWFSTLKWAGGVAPTLTTTANKTDVVGFLCTSSGNYDAFVIGQNL